MENARRIWDRLISAGLAEAGAAGLMGNLYAESGLRPDNLQNTYEKKLGYSDADYTAAVDCGAYGGFVSDGAGYGLAQWTYPSRKAALLACVKAQGRSVGDLDAQVGYLLQELQSLFPAVLDKLRTTSSVREASDCVLLQFERPADQSADNCARRAGFGQEFYERFAELKEDDDMVRFKTLDDVPGYYKDAVQKAVDKGALNGTGDGLNVSEDLCRSLSVLDRLGKLD